MINEISDLRIVLEACDTAVSELRSGSTPGPSTPLADTVQILGRIHKYLEELEWIVSSCSSGLADGPIQVNKVAKYRWLKEKSKVEEIKHRLRDSKQDLLMLLESHRV